MNGSDICERTFVKGFLIEAFSSLEEAQRYYYQLGQQGSTNVENRSSDKKDTLVENLYKQGPAKVSDVLVKNIQHTMSNEYITQQLVQQDGNFSKNGLENTFSWKNINIPNGRRAIWTENGTIQVDGTKPTFSFVVDNRKMMMSYRLENDANNKMKRPFSNTTRQTDISTEDLSSLKGNMTSSNMTCPYTISTLKEKEMQSYQPPCPISQTMCSSDAPLSENWHKARDEYHFGYSGSILPHSLSTVSMASRRSYYNDTWNNSFKSEQTSTDTSSKPPPTLSAAQRCENCGREHYGGFASGRFCSSKCARTIGGNARKRQRLEAQGIRFDDNGNPLDPIPKRLRYTPKHNIHREGDKPGKGYRLCIHCNLPTPNRKVKCQYCGKANPNAVRSRKLLEDKRGQGNNTCVGVDSNIPQTISNTSPTGCISTSRDSLQQERRQETVHSETEEEDDEDLVKEQQDSPQIQFLLNPK